MTCSNLDRFPSEPHWPSVYSSCAQALYRRQERATSAEYCFFKYRCWMNVIALLHLCCLQPLQSTAHCSLPAQGCCTIGFQQLQLIFALCISLGDMKWHRSHSHLISFSGSCLCCDESFHLLFFAGWWRLSSRRFQAKCIVYSFLQDHRQWIKTLNIPFPVCWKDDYGPITVPLYPNGAHSYHRTHSFVLMFLTLTQSCKGGLIMDATAFLFKPRTILPLIGLFWYSSPNPCPLLWIWWI